MFWMDYVENTLKFRRKRLRSPEDTVSEIMKSLGEKASSEGLLFRRQTGSL